MDFSDNVTSNGRALERYAFVLSGDRQSAQHLVQTALMKACRHWRRVTAMEFPDAYVRAPHDPDLATTIHRRARHRAAMSIALAATSIVTVVTVVAVVVVAVVAVVSVVVAGAGRTDDVAGPPGDSHTAVSACAPLDTGPLPSWALSGFSDPTATPPFARSASGDLVAIVFADPLQSPASTDGAQNKILWVTRTAALATDLLSITAQLENTDRLTEIDLGRPPGPSIVDLTAPGCWLMQLRWGAHTDTIALRYEAG